jgi:hypothetical protein
MDWVRILAYITRTVDQELLLRNEYLAAENRILNAQLKTCASRIFMQPSEDRYGEGRGRPGIQQRCRIPPLVRDDHPARLYSRTGVFATDASNPDTTT